MHNSVTTRLAIGLGVFGLLTSFVACSGSVKVEGDGCNYAGKAYALGASFSASDGCNRCSCSKEGVSCTEKACVSDGGAACTVDGKQYAAGQATPNVGCNTCVCTSSGEVQCTRSACLEDASTECAPLVSAMKAELARVQHCDSAAECGQPIPGSSCGGTRDWIARKDANLAEYLSLRDRVSDSGCQTEGGSTCDIPAADGFACTNHVCGWNHVDVEPEPACKQYDAGELCVRGTPSGDGELLAVGDSLQVTVRSSGCFSSSCTKTVQASCAIGSGAGFEVKANFCIADTSVPGGGCTADCGNVHADCSFGQPLSAGEHQVKLGTLAVGFQVPSKLPLGGLCAGSPL